MNTLQDWARAHGIPPEAITDLRNRLTAAASPSVRLPASRTSEAYVQSLVRLEAPAHEVWLTRNNVGAKMLKDETTGKKSFVRWGLANETPAENDVLKSADLIGVRKVLIQPRHVGQVIGQFVSRECKHADWWYGGGAHEEAQLNWALLIQSYGGDATFATGEGTFR